MVDPRKTFFVILTLTAFLLGTFLIPPSALAAPRSSYYDFGLYYNQPQVLGLFFSSLENLPIPKIPDELVPSPATGILPGSPLDVLEKGIENIQLGFNFDPLRKEELRLQFAQERLSEAKTLTDQGKIEAAAQAMDDYGHSVLEIAQTLSRFTEKNDPAAQTLAEKVEARLAAQSIFTQNAILSSLPAQAENWAIAAQATTEALDKIAEAKGAPAIPEELSTSIQKLKEQGLFSEEESNKLYSFKARGEVRAELDKLASSGQFPASELTKLDTVITEQYPHIQKHYT